MRHLASLAVITAAATAFASSAKPAAPQPGVGPFNTSWAGFAGVRDARIAGFTKSKKADAGAVVFLGDSITEGWDLGSAFPKLKTANRGISGDTSRGMLVRLKDNVLDLHPKGVVLLCGINDLAQPGGEPKAVAANVKSIVEAVRSKDGKTPIFVVETMPSVSRPVESIREVNTAVDKVLEKIPGVHRVRVFAAFADDKGQPVAALFKDGTHPNAAGYEVYTTALAPELKKAGLLQ